MKFKETALRFNCNGAWLYGIASIPDTSTSCGVLIIAGGPQYRVGSHRQFTLLARFLAAHGIPTMRFDYRGMGDSDGEVRDFENVDDDFRCAIDQFFLAIPSLKKVAIWGLCDAASAALFYAHQDARVTGLILLNPWVRTEEGIAKTTLKHYYVGRLFSPQLWQKIIGGNFSYRTALHSFYQMMRGAFLTKAKSTSIVPGIAGRTGSLPERMYQGLNQFKGQVFIILSGQDLTALEFSDLIKKSPEWEKLMVSPRIKCETHNESNHTFSRHDWRDQVATWTRDWVSSLPN